MACYLVTLGAASLLIDGKPVAPRDRRTFALLAILALAPKRWMLREHLIDLLWDDNPTSTRRHSLSQLLYQLRQLAPELVIDTRADAVRLVEEIKVDAVDFQTAVRDKSWELATSIWGGTFLETFTLPGIKSFSEWKDSWETTIDLQAGVVFQNRIAQAEVQGDWKTVERLAVKALERDPFDSIVHLARLKAIATAGDVSEAIRATQTLQDIYLKELGLPLPAAIRQFREDAIRAQSTVTIETPNDFTSIRFIGREPEWVRLTQAWRAFQGGRSQLIVLSGEPGIGKTRLVQHFLRWVALQGGRIGQGVCVDSGRSAPFSGVVSLLRELLSTAAHVRLPKPWHQILSLLLPEIDEFGDRSGAMHAPSRLSVLEAITQAILTVKATGDWVFHLDDTQWIDEDSRGWLQYLPTRLSDNKIFLVLTCRQSGAVRSQVIADSWRGLPVDIQELTLGPLQPADMEALRTAFQQKHEIDIDQLYWEKLRGGVGGRPFLLLHCLAERVRKTIAANDVVAESISLPATVDTFLKNLVRALSQGAQTVAGALAVLGGKSQSRVLGEVACLPAEAVATAIDELALQAIVCVTPTEVAFSHDLLKEASYGTLSPSRRAYLHSRAVRALRRRPGTPVGTLAIHLREAGNLRGTYHFARKAASRCVRCAAYEDAEFFLRLAESSASTVLEQTKALEEFADFLCATERYSEALAIYDRLQPLNLKLGRSSESLMGEFARLRVDLLEARTPIAELLTRGLAMVKKVQDVRASARCAGIICAAVEAAHDAGKRDIICDLVPKIAQLADELPIPEAKAQLLGLLARVSCLYGTADTARKYGEAAMAAAEAKGDRTVLVGALIGRGTSLLYAGRLREAEADFTRAWKMTDEPDLKHYRLKIVNNYAVVLFERGRTNDARRLLEQAIPVASAHDRLFLVGNIANIESENERHSHATDLADRMRLENATLNANWVEPFANIIDGLAAVDKGLWTEARQCLERFGSPMPNGEPPYPLAVVLAARVAANSSLEDAERLLEIQIGLLADRDRIGALRLELERGLIAAERSKDEGRRIVQAVMESATVTGAEFIASKALRELNSSFAEIA